MERMMRQTTEHRSYTGSAPVLSRHVLIPSCGIAARRRGFTLVEVMVAMAILLITTIGVMAAVAFAYTSVNDSEQRNTAKNIAGYTLEYLRSRTVTRGNVSLMAKLGVSNATTGTYGWYDPATNPNGAFPSIVDVDDLPLQSNGKPCNYTMARIKSGPLVDGQTNLGTASNDIRALGMAFQFSSKHPALPTEKFSDTPLAWTTVLQGYVSVRTRNPLDVSSLGATQNPAPEDWNIARLRNTTVGNGNGRYRTLLASRWTSLAVLFPGRYPLTAGFPQIVAFSPLATYKAQVYTADSALTTNTNAQYNPYYTTTAGDKATTQAYRGFRVLTQIVARTADRAVVNHVQYYDVTVRVLWMNGSKESSYELISQIVAY
jgi:prepilin-type N-terminal cleavage/methylation domain-containing protein